VSERWRKPLTIHAVEESGDAADQIAGVFYRGVAWTTDEEGLERIRQGRVCLMCVEPQETPFPERCALCGYRMAERQTKDMEIEFKGTRKLGPSTSSEEELDRLDEFGERLNHNPDASISVPGLWIPPGAGR
jgi:hypothetical protein